MSFRSVVSVENRSLQYVNSMNCIVIIGVGASGGGELYGWPKMQSMSGLRPSVAMASRGVTCAW